MAPSIEEEGAPTERREGRGRLSSIDMLPEEADLEITWANEMLRDRKVPANQIFAEFNRNLAAKGIAPISRSAWNRYSVRKALQFRKHDEARRMSAELVAQLGTDSADEVTVMIAEMLKVAMFEQLEGGGLTSKGVMELSRGLSSLVTAQKGSLEHRLRLQREEELKKAAEKVAEVGKKAGVSQDVLDQINQALGVG